MSTSPTPDQKPDIASSTSSKPSPTKKTTKPSIKSTIIGSPTKEKEKQTREAKRIALEALFDPGVKGEGMRVVAEKSGLSNQQVGDLFRPKRQNMRSKALSLFDSGGL